ncbi:MAG: hypothetical protein JJU02_10790 [Cryomorphaceae bacterium]|nr:hypothetical protein [Cryomorphaceae bacterium]
MENYTLKISANSTKAKALIDFLKSLDFIELTKEEHSEIELDTKSVASIEKGLEDLKNNRIHKDQDVRNSIRERILSGS